MGTTATTNPVLLNDIQTESISTEKIFFGHQSVGNDIVEGIRDLINTDPRLRLNLIKSGDPQSVTGPAFIEYEVGRNGYPETKTEEFENILDKGMGAEGGIAMHKYCYVDFDSGTDVNHVFEQYRKRIDALKAKYPALKIVHVTVPLTTDEAAVKAWVKGMLGRITAQNINFKRNQFNKLLKATYEEIDPIFDLAEVESTNSDGSRSFSRWAGNAIYSLSPEYTTDGGHLNALGRRKAATQLLLILSQLKR